ncbi:NADH-ubiquinone/plastoquinone oxidoreductase chain 4L family protein [Candidatus Neoehrlichia lotoris str. RAC413]|uniref:NADH-ubiquinone/plastoquinone oxidoreductase chain 4L family protein n=2 Tax=Candidatus Neoehrlichia procyonis TaxID=467750 RepID=A0A0F3NLR2_9RICK|nr:NADH-ubiquinone/plastoquinone oxidoreductase chain 4L family protein [Candidatus Neoehrlichia lotoris str. RAC413]
MVSMVLMVIGLYITIIDENYVRKLLGLNVLQSSVLLFYISIGYVKDASIPILNLHATLYSNPLPSVLMLTAIVVGVATLAVGLSIVVRIKEEFLCIQESELSLQISCNSIVDN